MQIFKILHSFSLSFVGCLKGKANCQASITEVSWIHRGMAIVNNSVYKWNIYDTLNLICRAYGSNPAGAYLFAISKNSAPTAMKVQSGSITYTGMASGSLVWSDFDGVQMGFENFVVIGTNYISNPVVSSNLVYDRRYINVAVLKTTDTGTYYCSVAAITSTSSTPVKSSGALKITVSTKPKQAHSTRAHTNSYLTYSAAIMGAYKLIF